MMAGGVDQRSLVTPTLLSLENQRQHHTYCYLLYRNIYMHIYIYHILRIIRAGMRLVIPMADPRSLWDAHDCTACLYI